MSLRKTTPFVASATLVFLFTSVASTNAAAANCNATASSEIVYTSQFKAEIQFFVSHDAPEKADGTIRYELHYTTKEGTKSSARSLVQYRGKRSGESVVGSVGPAVGAFHEVHYVQVTDVSCGYFSL